jgi:hypothetical protein
VERPGLIASSVIDNLKDLIRHHIDDTGDSLTISASDGSTLVFEHIRSIGDLGKGGLPVSMIGRSGCKAGRLAWQKSCSFNSGRRWPSPFSDGKTDWNGVRV